MIHSEEYFSIHILCKHNMQVASFPGSTPQLFSHCVRQGCEKNWRVEPENKAICRYSE